MGKNSKSQEAEIIMKTPTWNQQAHLPPVDLPRGFLGFFLLSPRVPQVHHHLTAVTVRGISIRSLGRCAQGAFHWLAQSVIILFFPLLESQAIGETPVFFIAVLCELT